MASYYLDGYTTPAGVDSRQKVKEYQARLGVTADGIWGPKTQAAYEASNASGGARWGASAGVNSAYGNFFNEIMGHFNIPQVQVATPSRTEIQADVEASIRPAAERAISTRRAQGETNKAELDADAAARGMGSSSFVSSMKGREAANVENDVAMIEAEYTATLAERVGSYLQYYTGLAAQASMQNAQLYASAESTAAGLASQWYQAYLSANAAAQRTSSARKRSAAEEEQEYFSMTAEDYVNYVARLSSAQRRTLFASSDAEAAESRAELREHLGAEGYAALVARYGPATAGGGTRETWQARVY